MKRRAQQKTGEPFRTEIKDTPPVEKKPEIKTEKKTEVTTKVTKK